MEAKVDIKLEDAFLNLEEIIKKLVASSISLEESFQLYKEGMNLLELFNKQIDQVE